jgi:NAD(P)-dependent dehydrogenase (short-subunit alcohol dehydrogenase family)
MTEQRIAFVTGASRGIGRACALHLARAGFDVVIAARTIKEEWSETARGPHVPGSLERTAEEIGELGRRAFITPLDLLDRDSCRVAVESALAEFGHVNVLVNNGIYVADDSMRQFEDTPIEEYDKCFSANVIAGLNMVKLLLPNFKALGSGVVIDLTSGAGQNETSLQPGAGGWPLSYSLTKAAFNRVAAGLGKELKRYNIAVVNLEPGFVATERMTLTMGAMGIDPAGGLSVDVPGSVCAYIASHPTPMTFSGRTVDAPQFSSWMQLLDSTTFPPAYGPANWGNPPVIPIAGQTTGVGGQTP